MFRYPHGKISENVVITQKHTKANDTIRGHQNIQSGIGDLPSATIDLHRTRINAKIEALEEEFARDLVRGVRNGTQFFPTKETPDSDVQIITQPKPNPQSNPKPIRPARPAPKQPTPRASQHDHAHTATHATVDAVKSRVEAVCSIFDIDRVAVIDMWMACGDFDVMLRQICRDYVMKND